MSPFQNVEVIHDYSALNRAVDFERNRKDGHLLALNRRTRLQATLARGAAAAGVILATGIAAALVLWVLGLRHPSAVEEAAEATSAPPIAREAVKTAEAPPVPPIIHEVEKAAEAANEVVNFTLFRQVPSGLDGYGYVVTGARFASSADVKPQSQWCYVERLSGSGTWLNLSLAEAPMAGHGAEPVAWSDQALAEAGLSREQASELSKKCRFLGVGPGPRQTSGRASERQAGFVTLSGEITEGFTKTIQTLFAEHPAARGLMIESPGGLVAEALEAGHWLRSRGKATLVTGECSSACVLVFAGGTERVARSNAQFGLHQAFFGADDTTTGAEAQAAIGQLLAYYMEAGIDPAVLLHGLTTAHEDITILNAREALGAGLVTRIAESASG